jgi:hypothetical protein
MVHVDLSHYIFVSIILSCIELRLHYGSHRLPRVPQTFGEGVFHFFGGRLRPMLPSSSLFFSVCAPSPSVALGEDGLPLVCFFPECRGLLSTRRSIPSPSAILPWVQHSGKIGFPECPIFGTRGSLWHSGNFGSPVVLLSFFSNWPRYLIESNMLDLIQVRSCIKILSITIQFSKIKKLSWKLS